MSLLRLWLPWWTSMDRKERHTQEQILGRVHWFTHDHPIPSHVGLKYIPLLTIDCVLSPSPTYHRVWSRIGSRLAHVCPMGTPTGNHDEYEIESKYSHVVRLGGWCPGDVSICRFYRQTTSSYSSSYFPNWSVSPRRIGSPRLSKQDEDGNDEQQQSLDRRISSPGYGTHAANSTYPAKNNDRFVSEDRSQRFPWRSLVQGRERTSRR